MSDADGDSTMHSSPELEADDEMFPDEGPSTPRNAASYALDPNAELSPPNSQGPSTTAFANPPPLLNSNGKRVLQSTAANATSNAAGAGSSALHTDQATGYQWSKLEDQPGYEWKNNRAREDEARALDQILDKHLQVKTRYGDPLKTDVPMTLKR